MTVVGLSTGTPTPNGDTDLILRCHTQEVTIQPGQAIACLDGHTDSGDPFTGFGDDVKAPLNSDLGQPAYDLGWNLNSDVVVNVVDALALKPRQGAECEWAAGGTP